MEAKSVWRGGNRNRRGEGGSRRSGASLDRAGFAIARDVDAVLSPEDPIFELEPLASVAKVPLVLVVGAGTPYRSLDLLLDTAKQKALFFASAGSGSVGHLTGELWRREVGINATHVPYKSAAPAMADVAGGQVDFFFASVSSGLPLIQAGRVRPLAVASKSRLSLLPDVPTFGELGRKNMEAEVIYGVVAPNGTSKAVIDALNAGLNDYLSTTAAHQALANLGADSTVMGGSVADFEGLLKAERGRWSEVVKASGAKVD